MIRNLKNKLKEMSSGSHSLKQADNYTSDDFIEIYRNQQKSSSADTWKTTHDFSGQIIESADHLFVKKRIIYGINRCFGRVNFSELTDLEFTDSLWWTRLHAACKISEMVFLDAETTGLAGGTGTCAFLIGLGYITGEGLVIEQYLMRDFDEEYPMLCKLINTLRKFKVLVTFNGKSFDWPLLESRLTYSRLGTINWDGAHLDLLHISRRLWGKRLERCSLSCIEESILGHIREDDIPGSRIPGIYFEYLENRNTDMMKKVIKHNEWDIAAIAALLLHIKKLYEDPLNMADDYELLGIARALEISGKNKEAVACYQHCIRISEKYFLITEAKKRLAYLKKRYEGPEKALHLWMDLAEEKGSMLLFPLIEMAKYFEHKKKDYQQALMCTERAIILADKLKSGPLKIKEELFHRRNRLIRKLNTF